MLSPGMIFLILMMIDLLKLKMTKMYGLTPMCTVLDSIFVVKFEFKTTQCNAQHLLSYRTLQSSSGLRLKNFSRFTHLLHQVSHVFTVTGDNKNHSRTLPLKFMRTLMIFQHTREIYCFRSIDFGASICPVKKTHFRRISCDR